MAKTELPSIRFSQKIFPWLVILAASAVYLATASRWVTFASLPVVGKLVGWDWWSIQTTPPLLYVLTLPVQMLPANMQPAIMNVLAAVLASLTLGTLAKSVAMLPQDRTREQRQRERGEGGFLSIPTNWIPPFFAVVALGLQSTFWQRATSMTGEMLNLFLFAHLIRCLLSYRAEKREMWLYQFAVVYGLATTNNWAMIGFFPAFLISLMWIKGRSFFDLKFVGKMVGFGILGLLLYLLMPALESAHGKGEFWHLLRDQLGQQKQILFAIPKYIPLILSLVPFLPLLSMTIRWPSNMGEANPVAAALTSLMFYLIHAVFLGFSIWVVFDPPFSPQGLGGSIPFLTFYYLSALNIGYYSGYFLLLFRQTEQRGWRRPSALNRFIGWIVTVAVWLGPIAVASALIYRNQSMIRGNSGTALKDYADLIASKLPADGALVLSDEPILLLLLEAHYSRQNQNPHRLISTTALGFRYYHKVLTRHYPNQWQDVVSDKTLPEPFPGPAIAQLIRLNVKTNQLFYLHPAIGPHILEFYHLVPHGIVYELKPFAQNEITPPAASPELQASNNKFWQEEHDLLNRLQPFNKQPRCDAAIVASYLSRSLDCWGVELHELGLKKEADDMFTEALRLNPHNVSAEINKASKVEKDNWSAGRSWSLILRENGPFCVPEINYDLGRTLAHFGLLRQSAEQLTHAVNAAPEKTDYLLALTDVLLKGRAASRALELLESAKTTTDLDKLPEDRQLEFIRQESMAQLAMTNYTKAEKILLKASSQYPKKDVPLAGLVAVYLADKKFPSALEVLEKQLELNSNNATAWLNKGAVYLQLNNNDKAVLALQKTLELQPDNPAALLNLSLVKFRTGDLSAAEKGYARLTKIKPNLPVPYYFLGEIAYQKKDKDTAIRHYEKFLTVAPPNIPEVRQVQERLKTLKGQ